MDEREDLQILRRREEEHVSIFKARAGMGAVILEGQEISAVVRYIETLERDAARRTTPDREAGLEDAALYMEQRAAQIESCGNLTAGTFSRIYRDEATNIRALKTAPTPTQLAALDRLAENERELGLDYMTAATSDKGGA